MKHDTLLSITKFAFHQVILQLKNKIKEERKQGKSDTEILNEIMEIKL